MRWPLRAKAPRHYVPKTTDVFFSVCMRMCGYEYILDLCRWAFADCCANARRHGLSGVGQVRWMLLAKVSSQEQEE